VLQRSETFRLHWGKIVIPSWAVLMFAASIAFVALMKEHGTLWHFNHFTSMAYCTSTEESVDDPDAVRFPYFKDK
jgi:hypothetical protein